MNYKVTIQPADVTYECNSNESILNAGLAKGFFLPFSCRSGVCGTCKGKVLKGDIDFGVVHPNYLSDEERAQGIALFCQAIPISDIEVQIDDFSPEVGAPPRFAPCRILEVNKLTHDVAIVRVGLHMNEPLMFKAGQYIEFVRKDGSRRSYSIATLPNANGVRQIELHIRHLEGGSFTDRIFNGQMEVGEIHKIELPLGSFYLRNSDSAPLILLATGTGFSPIKSMILDFINRSDSRELYFYWGGRTKLDLYMHQLCLEWARDHPNIHYIPVLSDESATSDWSGRRGLVHRAVADDFPDLSGHRVYACGNPAMIDASRVEFTGQHNLNKNSFYADSFLSQKEKSQTKTS
jgi:CDP-4-dehydro-6-deoxyglucose reductase